MDKIKIMVIDDSATIRQWVRSLALKNDDVIDFAGYAIDGEWGIKKLPMLKPDIIILDIEMPNMNGIEFLKYLKRKGINIPVIVFSSVTKTGAEVTMQCLSLGAVDYITKPGSFLSLEEVEKELIEKILYYGKKGALLDTAIYEKEEPVIPQEYKKANYEIVVIGISTGGPPALRKIIPMFPQDFPIPIAIVQHMPPVFTYEFAKALNEISNLRVKEAEDGDKLEAGIAVVAPGGKQLLVVRKPGIGLVAKVSDSDPVNGHKPSAEVLFKSALLACKDRVIAVIMTGMGKDGAEAIKEIKEAGGYTIGQDEKTSVIYGMPRVAYEIGGIVEQLPLERIPYRIINMVMEK